RAEAAALERLVHHHLARARTAARVAASAASTVAPLAVAEEVASALRRVFDGRGIVVAVAGDATAQLRVDPQDLTEMLGNLMENACKWARRRVEVSVAVAAGGVVVGVSDDGPGLTEDERRAALMRGTRFDEATPGTGLGLGIVADLAALYGGALDLQPSAAGGLAATLRLPGFGGGPGH
uniref:ATP-binding protein n=1 Tax=Neoroseomonas rubea TaxID=2748666 RepID=UPI001E457785